MSANDCKSATSIDFGVTNEFERVGEFVNVESVNTKDYSIIFSYLLCLKKIWKDPRN